MLVSEPVLWDLLSAIYASLSVGGGEAIKFSIISKSPGWVVSKRENFSQSRQFFALCAWRKKGVSVARAGSPPKFVEVWAGLNATEPAILGVP